MFSTESLLTVGGVGLLGAIVAYVLRNWLPARRSSNDQGSTRPLGSLEDAARRSESGARKKREAADAEAIREIAGRQHTIDPVADLRARLDRGTDTKD